MKTGTHPPDLRKLVHDLVSTCHTKALAAGLGETLTSRMARLRIRRRLAEAKSLHQIVGGRQQRS